MRLPIFVLLLFTAFSALFSQPKMGHWRDHLPYNSAQHVISTEDKVFCVANNNLFYYDKRDASINKLNKVTQLSDIGVSAIAYNEELKILVIGYSSGNIDLLDPSGVYNINAIERKTIASTKSINNIHLEGNLAYLATDFAIVVLNIENREIKDTYYIGNNGSFAKIIDITLDDQYIYALKDDAIAIADKNSPFLIDFSQWKDKYTKESSNSDYTHITNHKNKIYVLRNVVGYRNDSLYVIQNNQMQYIDLDFEADYYNVKSQNGYLQVSRTWSSILLDDAYNIQGTLSATRPFDAAFEGNIQGYIASREGLIKIEGYKRDTIVPEGPDNIGAVDFYFRGDNLYVAGGTKNIFWSRNGMHKYHDNKWTTIDENVEPALKDVLNISNVAVDRKDHNHVYGASYGYGLIEFRNDKVEHIYHERNSILRTLEGYEMPDTVDGVSGYVRIVGMDFDANNNLVFAVTNIKNPIFILTPEGKMYNLESSYTGFGSKQQIQDIMVSSSGYIWVLLKNAGLYVYDYGKGPEDKEDDREIKFNATNQNGDIRNEVYSIVEDLNKNIWVGTGNGPLIYYENTHTNIFDEESPYGQQILLPDIEGTAQYLLVSDRITCITLDGANRKWLGTQSSGAYLVSDDGYTQIHNFRKENSPIFNNNILDIGIDHNTGEVFFGTDNGIVSYRAEATVAGSTFGDVYVFPNPVRPEFSGSITITGLARDVNVKITDISGNLVYETDALGGQAIWDGHNFDGERVHTGVYLVFCSNDDGSETYVTKLLFVN